MATWRPLPLGSPLYGQPSGLAPAPVIGKLESLPFNALSWEDFERLQWRVMRDVEGLRHAQIYGVRGQAQYGLDIVALAPDGTGVALQSKKYTSFGAANIKAAVKKFRETKRPFPVDRLIIGVASAVQKTAVIEELAAQVKALHPIKLEMWDAQELSLRLRGRPEIVIEFFGMPTAEAFCLPFKVDVEIVPAAEVVAVREAIARTPEVATGAQQLFDDAEVTSDAMQALSLVEAGQQKLRDAGFGPHAAQHDKERIRLLAKVNRTEEAARYVLERCWTAFDQGLATTAQIAQSQLDELSDMAPADETVKLSQQVAAIAMALYVNPLGYVPEVDTLRIGSFSDQVQLALLAGETALANDDTDWLIKASPFLAELSSIPMLDVALRTRLRLLLAETTADWSELLGDARQLRLGHGLLGLVTARYARACALQQKFQEADLSWDEAAGSASLAKLWGEASTWIFSRRAFRTHWNPFTSNELLPLQTAIREMGASTPLIPKATGAYEEALSALSEQRLRSAAISAQRALRDAVTGSDWVGEERARRVLASILIESDEPTLAAHHLVRAGAAKAVEAMGKSLTQEFVNILSDLDAPNYWTVGTSYRLIAIQADLVPENLIRDISEHIIAELAAADAGTLPDLRTFSTSRYNNAVKALAGVADRLDEDQADIVLRHFEKQPPVESNHYRFHDEDEAVVIAKIAKVHSPLAERAIPHLVHLLGRSQGARKSITLEAIDGQQSIASQALTALAEAGNQWARETLSFMNRQAIDDIAVSEALLRLSTPLKHTEGVFSTGTNAVGDSLLIRHLASDEIESALAELLMRADDPRVSSSDRGQYLIAASNLGVFAGASKRNEFFTAAMRMAASPTPSEHDKFNEQFRHKLGGMRINGEPRDSRGQAVMLAAMLAQDDSQRHEVRRLAYSLLGEESDYWPTRALQQLGDTVRDDLAFLASQGWAVRSLAAMLWVDHGEPPHLGHRLAEDPDVRVRRAFARELARRPAASHGAIRERLAADPAFSVRAALADQTPQSTEHSN